jgi:hypothetical protein
MALAQFAPQIIRWVSGSEKAAEAAEHVVDIARTVTGTNTAEEAVSAIQADPNLAMQLQMKILDQAQEMDKLYLADRSDAREREIATGDKTPRNLAYLLTGGFFCALGYLMVQGLPAQGIERDITLYMLATLQTAWLSAIAYYFGTTKNSGDKDVTIKSLSRHP